MIVAFKGLKFGKNYQYDSLVYASPGTHAPRRFSHFQKARLPGDAYTGELIENLTDSVKILIL